MYGLFVASMSRQQVCWNCQQETLNRRLHTISSWSEGALRQPLVCANIEQGRFSTCISARLPKLGMLAVRSPGVAGNTAPGRSTVSARTAAEQQHKSMSTVALPASSTRVFRRSRMRPLDAALFAKVSLEVAWRGRVPGAHSPIDWTVIVAATKRFKRGPLAPCAQKLSLQCTHWNHRGLSLPQSTFQSIRLVTVALRLCGQ